MGENVGNIYPAGFHAHGPNLQNMTIEVDSSAPSDEWRVHLGDDDLDEATTVDAQDIDFLVSAAHPIKTQAHFDSVAATIWPGTYAGFSSDIKARCRWAWANRP